MVSCSRDSGAFEGTKQRQQVNQRFYTLQFPVLPVGHCVIVLRGPKVASAVWCSATLSG